MSLGILLATCSCITQSFTTRLVEYIRNLAPKIQENRDIIVEYVPIHDLDLVKSKLTSLARQCETVIVLPVALNVELYSRIEQIVNEVKASVGKPIELISPLVNELSLAKFLVESTVYLSESIIKRLTEVPVLRATGDVNILLEIETNTDINNILSSVSSSKDIIVDDIRVLTYIDTRNLRPGTRVYLEEDIERFSYSPGSIVVIASYVKPIERVLMLVDQGIKPSLIIATPPCFSQREVELKRSILKLDVPAIVTTGFRGGVHVAGTILNMIFSVR